MEALIIFTILSPAIPVIVLYCMAFKNNQRRRAYLTVSFIICVLSVTIGLHLAHKASGWDGLAYIGFIYGGALGTIITLITIIVVMISNHTNDANDTTGEKRANKFNMLDVVAILCLVFSILSSNNIQHFILTKLKYPSYSIAENYYDEVIIKRDNEIKKLEFKDGFLFDYIIKEESLESFDLQEGDFIIFIDEDTPSQTISIYEWFEYRLNTNNYEESLLAKNMSDCNTIYYRCWLTEDSLIYIDDIYKIEDNKIYELNYYDNEWQTYHGYSIEEFEIRLSEKSLYEEIKILKDDSFLSEDNLTDEQVVELKEKISSRIEEKAFFLNPEKMPDGYLKNNILEFYKKGFKAEDITRVEIRDSEGCKLIDSNFNMEENCYNSEYVKIFLQDRFVIHHQSPYDVCIYDKENDIAFHENPTYSIKDIDNYYVERVDAELLNKILNNEHIETIDAEITNETPKETGSPFLKVEEMKESNLKEQLAFIKERGFINGDVLGFEFLDVDCDLDSNGQLIESCFAAKKFKIAFSSNEEESPRYTLKNDDKQLILYDDINKIAYIEDESIKNRVSGSYEVQIVDCVDSSLMTILFNIE